jgi:hypothetical protein
MKSTSSATEILDPPAIASNGTTKPSPVSKEPEAIASDEDAVTQAVQILSNLATLKLKAQELRDQALQSRAQVDLLFSDETVSEEDMNSLKDGFKVLKAYAQINLRFREARAQAEQARAVLDQALRG